MFSAFKIICGFIQKKCKKILEKWRKTEQMVYLRVIGTKMRKSNTHFQFSFADMIAVLDRFESSFTQLFLSITKKAILAVSTCIV